MLLGLTWEPPTRLCMDYMYNLKIKDVNNPTNKFKVSSNNTMKKGVNSVQNT